MPELPEVETVRRQLERALVGRRFERVEIFDPRLVRPLEPAEVAAELERERVEAVERRGKYLIVRFESGRVLLIHLRMTGSLLSVPSGSLPEDPHRRAVVKLDDGSDVAYRDVRRFGTWLLLEPGEAEPYLAARVGDEPLDALFTAARPRPAGIHAARLPPPRRQRRLDAGRVPRLPTPRRAVRPLRDADRPHTGRRPHYVVLSHLPARGAGSGGEELVEATFPVEAP